MIAHGARDKYDIYVNQFYFKDINSLFDRTVSLVWSVISPIRIDLSCNIHCTFSEFVLELKPRGLSFAGGGVADKSHPHPVVGGHKLEG